MQEPQLFLIPHSQLQEEQYSKNQISKKVYVVVKNLSFVFDIQANFDLSKSNLSAKLYYDYDEDKPGSSAQEVNYVKSEPLEFKVSVLESGAKASIEFKIKVLTSQHEDMLFRIRVTATDPITHRMVEAFTQPIKVISKLAPPKTKAGKEPVNISPPIKKRASNDQVANILQRLEQQQMEQLRLMQVLFSRLFGEVISSQQMNLQTLSTLAQNTATLGIADVDSEDGLPTTKHDMGDPDSEQDFDVSFWKLAQSLGEMSAEAKVSKVEEMLKRLPAEHADKIYEFLELFSSVPSSKRYRVDKTQQLEPQDR